jgi:ComF family protein
MKLLEEDLADFDILTWVPVSPLRRFKRGYDQVELLARALGRELGTEPIRLLRKTRNAPPQSGISGEAARRANVLGAYRVTDPQAIRDKRILLLDDVITTGATASECARTLLTAKAKQVNCAAVARRHENKKASR